MTAILEPSVFSQFSSPKSFTLFRIVDVGYTEAILRQVASCRHQHIIQEVDLEIPLQYLEDCIHQWQVSRFR